MENIRGKSLKEWKEGSDKDKYNIPMRTQKYIVCLEERIEQLLIQPVSNSYAVVRWHENNHEDVVCVDKQVALNYIEKYNNLAGEEKCYLDKKVWLPLTKV